VALRNTKNQLGLNLDQLSGGAKATRRRPGDRRIIGILIGKGMEERR
jgi:hypothetical protein